MYQYTRAIQKHKQNKCYHILILMYMYTASMAYIYTVKEKEELLSIIFLHINCLV